MAHAVGVDLGTTYTCAAVAAPGTRAHVVQLSGTSQTIPSVVSITDEGVLAGEAAERRLVSHPASTAREFKRRLGDATPILLGDSAHGAEVLTGHLLAEVLERVERSEGSTPAAVGLAHPAAWGPFRLDLLRDAARQAGVDDAVLVPEPVAAAIANRDRVPADSLVAVYDLGGGTFDAAVVRMGETPEVVGTPEGVERLGGIDFDQAILAHVDAALDGQVFGLDTSDPDARSALMQLRAECQRAKEHLSADTDVDIPVSLPDMRTSVRLTRSEFESMVRPRLADSLAVFDRVAASAGGWEAISTVLLVGGSSNMPIVGQAVSEHTGCPIVTATNPHLAIAIGTAEVTAQRVLAETVQIAAAADPLVGGDEDRAEAARPEAAAVAAVDAAASHPAAGAPVGDSAGGSRLALLAGLGLAAVVAGIIAFLVLGGGGDESADAGSSADTQATPVAASADEVEPGDEVDDGATSSDDADTADTDTDDADTDDADTDDQQAGNASDSEASTAAEPARDDEPAEASTPDAETAPTPADSTESVPPVSPIERVARLDECARTDTAIDAALVANGVVVTVQDREVAEVSAVVNDDECRVDLDARSVFPGVEVPAPLRGAAIAGDLFALAGDGAGLIGSLSSRQTRLCPLLTGNLALNSEGVAFVFDNGGEARRIRTSGPNCEERNSRSLAGFDTTALGVRSPTEVALAGRIDGVDAVRVFLTADSAADVLESDPTIEGGFGSLDAIVPCGPNWCVLDLERELVHVVSPGGEWLQADPFDGTPLEGAGALISSSGDEAGNGYFFVAVGDERVLVRAR